MNKRERLHKIYFAPSNRKKCKIMEKYGPDQASKERIGRTNKKAT